MENTNTRLLFGYIWRTAHAIFVRFFSIVSYIIEPNFRICSIKIGSEVFVRIFSSLAHLLPDGYTSCRYHCCHTDTMLMQRKWLQNQKQPLSLSCFRDSVTFHRRSYGPLFIPKRNAWRAIWHVCRHGIFFCIDHFFSNGAVLNNNFSRFKFTPGCPTLIVHNIVSIVCALYQKQLLK